MFLTSVNFVAPAEDEGCNYKSKKTSFPELRINFYMPRALQKLFFRFRNVNKFKSVGLSPVHSSLIKRPYNNHIRDFAQKTYKFTST